MLSVRCVRVCAAFGLLACIQAFVGAAPGLYAACLYLTCTGAVPHLSVHSRWLWYVNTSPREPLA